MEYFFRNDSFYQLPKAQTMKTLLQNNGKRRQPLRPKRTARGSGIISMMPVLVGMVMLLCPALSTAFPVGGYRSGLFTTSATTSRSSSTHLSVSTSTGQNYDIVKVDLEDGRDYPIYIGTSYTDEQITDMLSSHVDGTKALVVTNDRIAPIYLDKYTKLLSAKK
jgi:hypothetical protein